MVFLQYPEEDHALEDFDNRRDYQRRILQWFGHFLKRETAPAWITTGPRVTRTAASCSGSSPANSASAAAAAGRW